MYGRIYGKSSFGCLPFLLIPAGIIIFVLLSPILIPTFEFLINVLDFLGSVGETLFGEGNAAILFIILWIGFMGLLVLANRFLIKKPSKHFDSGKVQMTRTQYRLSKEGWISRLRKAYNAPSPQEKVKIEKITLLEDKIDIANEFLRDEINILKWFQDNEDTIKDWFYRNCYLKEKKSDYLPVTANYSYMKLTLKQTNSLIDRLNLHSHQYIPKVDENPSKESTIEFIVDNCEVINSLRNSLKEKGFNLYIRFHYASFENKNTTLCFGLTNVISPLPFYKR
ncbi:hypothetical protein [Priestia aryabhattai]